MVIPSAVSVLDDIYHFCCCFTKMYKILQFLVPECRLNVELLNKIILDNHFLRTKCLEHYFSTKSFIIVINIITATNKKIIFNE